MALQITKELVLNYLLKDIDLPEGLRLVSVNFDHRTRRLRTCELEKDGQTLKLGDRLLDDGSIVRSIDMDA